MAKISGRKFALIGAMGSGKSALARRLSAKYGATVFDTDAEFVRRHGEINAFFGTHGEAEFRKIEQNIITEAAYSDADIVATGGGAVLCKAGMCALRKARDIAYLTAPSDVLKARIARSDRPLKNDFDAIMTVRERLYKKYADYTVDSSVDSLAEFETVIELPRPNRYDVVLCDADDTVLDFQTGMRYAVVTAARDMGITHADDEIISAYSGIVCEVWGRLERGEITREELDEIRFRMFGEALGIEYDSARMNELYIKYMCGTKFIIDGALEFLSSLRSRGIKVYIVTNSFYRIAKERLKVLDGYIDGAFVSERVGYDKPDTRFFDNVLGEIGVTDTDRVLVFGDGETSDIAGGVASGLDTCLYDRTGQKHTAADFAVGSYAELLDLV